MKFTFKIGAKIKEAWPLYKENFWVLLIMTIATFAIQFVGQGKKEVNTLTLEFAVLMLVMAIVSLFVSYMWLRLILNIVDKKEFNLFSVQAIPTLEKLWNYIKTSILYGFCVMAGFVLLVIPAFYVAGRLMFAVYISIEKNQGGRASIKESWDMTKGYAWQLFWKSFFLGLFMVVGFLALIVGSLVTYPIGFIVMIMMYREFQKFKMQNISNPIPVEVSPQAENIKEIPIVPQTENPQ